MSRTNSANVQGVLLADYDGTTDLTPFIAAATVIVDRVVVMSVSKGLNLLDTEAELVERWIAAHFYAQSDKPYQSKSAGGASASFQGQTGQGFESTLYGQTAMRVDYSGSLRNLDKGQRAGGFWMGKTIPEQLSYENRMGGPSGEP